MFRHFALLAVAALFAAPAGAQTEEILDNPTGWTYRYGASSANIATDVNAGLRPFSIQRVASNSYDVITVQNSGSYAVAGFGTGNMHYNRTVAQLGADLANRRLVSLDCYEVAGQTQISAISIPSSGVGWGWLVGQTRQQIVDWVQNTTPALRITDLSIYNVGGQRYYAAVAVYNQGAQYQGWWWYFDKTNEEIVTLLEQNSARLIDVELETPPTLFTPARFACVMVAQNPGAGWYHGSLTGQQVDDLVNQTGGRLTSLHRHATATGATRFAVSLVDNADPQTRRMRGYMAAEATTGTYGFKLKQVGGPVLASLNETFVFEPASSMKILHGAYAISECAQGNRALDEDIWVPNRCTDSYWNNVCPEDAYSCNPGLEDLSISISRMLQNSHNGRTRTLEELFGRTTLNDFAEIAAGLDDTRINHTLGCLCGNPFNTTTASDMVSFYEQIGDGSFFTSTWRDALFGLMANVDDWGYGNSSDEAFYTLGQVINQEAATTDLTSAEIIAFRDAVQYATKGGAYGCDGTMWRSSASWSSLPIKIYAFGIWLTVHRDYAISTFVHGGNDPGSLVAYPASEEILREQIREALETWDDACATGVAGHPASTTVDEGQDAQFTITAGGTGNADYQWQKLVSSQWVPLVNFPGQVAGATTAALTLLAVEPSDAGSFRCRITKICGTSYSNAATLTVIPDGATAVPGALPSHLVMHAPAPNPFNPQVTLRFELPRQTDIVALEVFDVAGRRVRVMTGTSLAAGAHEFTWNGTDDGGRRMASGTYLARLRAGNEQATQRVVMVE